MTGSMVKKVCAAAMALLLMLPACASLAGCTSMMYTLDDKGNKIRYTDVDLIESRFSEEECRVEAERLLKARLETVSRKIPSFGNDTASYTFRSDELPFDVTVYSSHRLYVDPVLGTKILEAHAYTDYYERMMEYKRQDADAIAEKYGLEVKRKGQSCTVSVSSFGQLEDVYQYLAETNNLYDFTVEESEMTNILRDIRNRPTLKLFLALPENGRDDKNSSEDEVITLYYTINHDQYNYTKTALLSAIQESYIEAIDRAGIKDSAVTDEVRKRVVKPALTQLCINGRPVQQKECDGFTLDPNIVFDYNWLMDAYYGDVRLCAPAEDYEFPPTVYGDDRNFRYLVELLGGRYESHKDDSILNEYYKAEWWLGGDKYTASCMCSSYIPIMSDYWKNDEYLAITHAYSKEMWGLENGYGAEDYYVRMTPDALGSLLGVEAVPDYEKGTLNLVTPEGYFDHTPPEPEFEAETFEEKFFTEGVLSANGLVRNHTHYIIYADDGSVMEEETTVENIYADCTQVAESVVMLRLHGIGSVDNLTFFHTDTKEITQVFDHADLLQYPYILYCPVFSGEIVLRNVESGAEKAVIDDGYKSSTCIISYSTSDDGLALTIKYLRSTGEGSTDFEEALKTVRYDEILAELAD